MKWKRIMAIFLAVVLCLSFATVASAASADSGLKASDFSDFNANAWYAEAVEAAVENGLLIGKSARVLDPNGNLTRAEMAAVINRSFGTYKTTPIDLLSYITLHPENPRLLRYSMAKLRIITSHGILDL